MENNMNSTMPTAKASLISVGDLFRSSLAIYKNAFWKLVGLSALPVLGVTLVSIVVGVFVVAQSLLGCGSAGSAIVNILLILLGIAAVIFAILFAIMAQAALIIMIDQGPTKTTIKAALGQARKFVWQYLWVSILLALAVAVGFVLIVIPGIYLMVALFASSYIVILEGKRNLDVLRRSRQLVKGYWWPVFGRILLTFAIGIIISIIASPFGRDIEDSSASYNIVESLMTLIVTPFLVHYMYSIYKSLVKIKS